MHRDDREIFEEHSNSSSELQEFKKTIEKQKKQFSKKRKSRAKIRAKIKIILQEILNQMSSISINYRSIRIQKRSSQKILILKNFKENSYKLFLLYFSKNIMKILVKNVNANAVLRRQKIDEKFRKKIVEQNITMSKQRSWNKIIDENISIFANVILTRDFCDLKRDDVYWNSRNDRSIN